MAVDLTDRLRELRGNATSSSPQPLTSSEGSIDEEFGTRDLDECFSQVDKISKATSLIEELTDKIPPVHKRILTSVGAQKDDAIARHNELMNQVKDYYKTAINGLKRLDMEVKTAEGGPERFSAEYRIKKSQHSSLSRNLQRVMLEYNSLENSHRESMKELMKRQLKTVGSSTAGLTEDDLDDMVESKEAIFTQSILIATASKRKDVEEIEQRKKELLKLEENILELNEMFYDMMLLVEEQGELVDSIEKNVERSTAFVQKAAVDTKTAVKLRRKNTTLRWIICVVITVVVAVLLVIIGAIIAAVVGIQSD